MKAGRRAKVAVLEAEMVKGWVKKDNGGEGTGKRSSSRMKKRQGIYTRLSRWCWLAICPLFTASNNQEHEEEGKLWRWKIYYPPLDTSFLPLSFSSSSSSSSFFSFSSASTLRSPAVSWPYALGGVSASPSTIPLEAAASCRDVQRKRIRFGRYAARSLVHASSPSTAVVEVGMFSLVFYLSALIQAYGVRAWLLARWRKRRFGERKMRRRRRRRKKMRAVFVFSCGVPRGVMREIGRHLIWRICVECVGVFFRRLRRLRRLGCRSMPPPPLLPLLLCQAPLLLSLM